MKLKITDFFSHEELLEVESPKSFLNLSSQYSLFCQTKSLANTSREEEIVVIRCLIRLLSSIFGLPIIIACDHYVRMLDSYDYYEADRAAVEMELHLAIEEHLINSEIDLDEDREAPLMLTDHQSSSELDKFKKLLEQSWRKDQDKEFPFQ